MGHLPAAISDLRILAVGAWGSGPFENDDAQDWLAHLDAALPQTLSLTFRPVVAIEPELYLESVEASEAVAAAEVVAALKGLPCEALVENVSVRNWVMGHRAWLSPSLIEEAARAVERILAASELRDLWQESDEFPEGSAGLDDLLLRLRS